MSLGLLLQVEDVPYIQGESLERIKRRVSRAKASQPYKRKGAGPGVGYRTTFEVATILERRYHIMEFFSTLHQEDISKVLSEALSRRLDLILEDRPTPANAYRDLEARIELLFTNFIKKGEMALSGNPGIPTKAALMGINHRLGIRKGRARPSFWDTGLYVNSFKATIYEEL